MIMFHQKDYQGRDKSFWKESNGNYGAENTIIKKKSLEGFDSRLVLKKGKRIWNHYRLFSSQVVSDPMDCSMPDFPVVHTLSLLKLVSIELMTPSNHLMLPPSPLALNIDYVIWKQKEKNE